MGQPKEINVLMVCLGNICRSPMAEAVLKHQISQRASLKGKFTIHVDSAGTGAYHESDDADERTVATCRKHKIPISCTARAVTRDDFLRFDYILAMDNSNLQTLLHRRPPRSKAHIALFGAYDPTYLASLSSQPTSNGHHAKPQAISDPYYGGNSGFDKCFEQCTRYAQGFLDSVEAGIAIPAERSSRKVKDVMGM